MDECKCSAVSEYGQDYETGSEARCGRGFDDLAALIALRFGAGALGGTRGGV